MKESKELYSFVSRLYSTDYKEDFEKLYSSMDIGVDIKSMLVDEGLRNSFLDSLFQRSDFDIILAYHYIIMQEYRLSRTNKWIKGAEKILSDVRFDEYEQFLLKENEEYDPYDNNVIIRKE